LAARLSTTAPPAHHDMAACVSPLTRLLCCDRPLQESNVPRDEASIAFAELDRFLQDNLLHLCFGLLLGVVVVMFLVANVMVGAAPVAQRRVRTVGPMRGGGQVSSETLTSAGCRAAEVPSQVLQLQPVVRADVEVGAWDVRGTGNTVPTVHPGAPGGALGGAREDAHTRVQAGADVLLTTRWGVRGGCRAAGLVPLAEAVPRSQAGHHSVAPPHRERGCDTV